MTTARVWAAAAAFLLSCIACKGSTSPSNGSPASKCAAVTCQALDACHVAGACDEATGLCSNPTQLDGTPCGSGHACFTGACLSTGGSVLEHHGGPGRNGVYVDPTLTKASAATFHVDPSFQASVAGAVYAQPLFFAAGPGGKDVVIVATEQNNVAALDAVDGHTIWIRNVGAPVPLSSLPCGNINPMGITGTPVIDEAARRIYLDAMTTPDAGTTKKHLVFALSIDDGSIIAGWPVDVSAAVSFNGTAFDSAVQGQRAALALVGGTLYVPYAGHWGDCGSYRGWVVGIPTASPASPSAWATGARGGGIWGPSGVASDGTSIYVATGNTFGVTTWQGGEALIRFAAGPTFSGLAADYFAPSNWVSLDGTDTDIGGTGALVVDVPGANPSALLVGLGKDGKIYLLDRTNLGGIGGQVAVAQVSSSAIINAAASYTTAQGTYVVFKGPGSSCPVGQSGELTAVRITATTTPTIVTAWCARQNGQGSPMVTTTDGSSQAIVWSVGAESDQRLHGLDGDTGQVVFAGGGVGDTLGSVRRFSTPMLAKGRIFVGVDGGVRALVR